MQVRGLGQGLTHTAEGQLWERRVHDDIVGCHATAGGLCYHPSDQLPIMGEGTQQIRRGHNTMYPSREGSRWCFHPLCAGHMLCLFP